MNPYEYSSDDPTVNGFVMVSRPMNSASAVGKMGDSTPVYADERFPAQPALYANRLFAESYSCVLLVDTGDDQAQPISNSGLQPSSLRPKYAAVPPEPTIPEVPLVPKPGQTWSPPGLYPGGPVIEVTYKVTATVNVPVRVKVPGNPARDPAYVPVTAGATVQGVYVTGSAWVKVPGRAGDTIRNGVLVVNILTPVLTIKWP